MKAEPASGTVWVETDPTMIPSPSRLRFGRGRVGQSEPELFETNTPLFMRAGQKIGRRGRIGSRVGNGPWHGVHDTYTYTERRVCRIHRSSREMHTPIHAQLHRRGVRPPSVCLGAPRPYSLPSHPLQFRETRLFVLFLVLFSEFCAISRRVKGGHAEKVRNRRPSSRLIASCTRDSACWRLPASEPGG